MGCGCNKKKKIEPNQNKGGFTEKAPVQPKMPNLAKRAFSFAKSDGTFIYTGYVGATSANYLKLGYTPGSVANFSKAAAIIIDTNNNVSLGAGIISSSQPLYAAGNSVLVSGIKITFQKHSK